MSSSTVLSSVMSFNEIYLSVCKSLENRSLQMKWRILRWYHTGFRADLKSKDKWEKKGLQRHSRGRWPYKDGGTGWGYAVTGKGMPGTTRNWKRQEGLFPRNLRGNMALLALWLHTFGFYNIERINFSWLMPLNVPYFFEALVQNSHLNFWPSELLDTCLSGCLKNISLSRYTSSLKTLSLFFDSWFCCSR